MNKLFPIVLALLFLGCEGKSVNDTIFSANLRKYYFPIEKFIDNPQVYIYKDDVNGYVKDIIKCESFIQKNGDTLFVSTFYNNYWSAGAEWNELCLSEGLINIDSKDSKMISSPTTFSTLTFKSCTVSLVKLMLNTSLDGLGKTSKLVIADPPSNLTVG